MGALVLSYGFALAAMLALLASPVNAQQVIERGADIQRTAPVSIKLDAIPTNSLVLMLMRDVMKVPYVIAPDVLKDSRPVSVNLSIPRRDVPIRVVQFLRSMGFTVTLNGGTVYVTKGKSPATAQGFESEPPAGPVMVQTGDAVPSGSPLARPAPVESYSENRSVALNERPPEPVDPPGLIAYLPAHRDPGHLASVLEPLFPSVTFGARNETRGSGQEQAIFVPDVVDVLIMTGPADELERVKATIAILDRARPIVAVKAVVMQVSNTVTRGSALSLLASIAGGKVEAGSFNAMAPGAQFVRLSVDAFQAVFSAVREDARFNVVASPNLSAMSGAVAVLNAGSQVPTLGAVTVSEGTSVQSVVYRDSGITLQVRPVVRGGLIHLEVRQERSNFVPTTTGVDDSPTLQTASVTAQAVLRPGETMALAGLTEQSDANRKEGLFGGILSAKSRDKSDSELLVMLQADLVPMAEAIAGEFIDLGPVDPEPVANGGKVDAA